MLRCNAGWISSFPQACSHQHAAPAMAARYDHVLLHPQHLQRGVCQQRRGLRHTSGAQKPAVRHQQHEYVDVRQNSLHGPSVQFAARQCNGYQAPAVVTAAAAFALATPGTAAAGAWWACIGRSSLEATLRGTEASAAAPRGSRPVRCAPVLSKAVCIAANV